MVSDQPAAAARPVVVFLHRVDAGLDQEVQRAARCRR